MIEVDGAQHFETKGQEKDVVRDAFLNEKGLAVLRYSNRDVHANFEDAAADILIVCYSLRSES